MSSKLVGKSFPFSILEPENGGILKDVKPIYEYDENGKRTSKIVGFAYTVISTSSFESYRIKVAQTKPLIDSVELQTKMQSGDHVYVTFTNPTIRAYWSRQTNSYEDSIKADDISLTEIEI